MPVYDYDRYGTCIFCSKSMVVEEAQNGKVIKRFTVDYAETGLLMSDGSQMRVCTCKNCQPSFDESKFEYVMGKVYKGWEYEIQGLKWTEEQKQKYLDQYKKLSIVSFAEK